MSKTRRNTPRLTWEPEKQRPCPLEQAECALYSVRKCSFTSEVTLWLRVKIKTKYRSSIPNQKAQSPERSTIILNSSMVPQVENSTSVLHVIVPCQTTGAQRWKYRIKLPSGGVSGSTRCKWIPRLDLTPISHIVCMCARARKIQRKFVLKQSWSQPPQIRDSQPV